jgi:phospholipid/cholesterol/gamma-HCH transport system ATP-binding protein
MPFEPAGAQHHLLAPDLELVDITTIIDDAAVLHRLRLSVPAGKVTVLMGPSGAGKTTLIKHVLGLLEPDGGTVRIAGRDVWDSTPEQWTAIRKGMGAMLGGHNLYSTSLFSSYTVLENLTYTLKSLGVPEDEQLDRSRAMLRELMLDDMADSLPEKLPAHASKRLALARALVIDAPLTVLDEIDVGLDREHGAAMLEAVHRMRARTGCTLLITTHNLELARNLADNLAVLVNGRIVASGPPTEVLDGIESTDDFDRRFEFSDFVGPPRIDAAEIDALQRHRSPEARRPGQFSGDPRLIWAAAAAVVLIIVLFVVVKLLV